MKKKITAKMIQEYKDEIVLPNPKITYEPVVSIDAERVFEGKLMPIPYVLILYLHECELKVFAIILEQIRTTGNCVIRGDTFCTLMSVSAPSVYTALAHLANMGIVTVSYLGRRRNRKIDFNVIKRLEEITDGMKPGAISGLRRMMKDRNIMKLPKVSFELWTDKYEYKDEIEEEEYD